MPTVPIPDLTRILRAGAPVVDAVHRSLPIRLPQLRFAREIAFFGYSQNGYDGDTEDQEDIFVASPLTGAVRRVVDDRGAAYKSDRDPAWSPDRRSLATHYGTMTDPESRLRIVDAATGAVMHDLVKGYSPEWLDATTLLYLDSQMVRGRVSGPDVYAVDIATSRVRRITTIGRDAEVTGISWHPTAGLALGYAVHVPVDVSAIAVVSAAAVAAARAPGGTPVRRSALTPLTPGTEVAGPDWSPSGDRIALTTWATGAPSRVGYLDVASGVVRLVPGPRLTGGPLLNDAGAVFGPDGRTIAFCRGNEDEWSEIWLYSVLTRRARRLTDDHEGRFKGGLDW